MGTNMGTYMGTYIYACIWASKIVHTFHTHVGKIHIILLYGTSKYIIIVHVCPTINSLFK